MIKLCYKSYPYKMTLGAMKQFKQSTGNDLWCKLLQFMECYAETSGEPVVTRMRRLYEVIDFEAASHLFYSLIRAEDKSIPIEEIEDAMFKVGWLPTQREGDMSEPWPLVLVVVAHEINKQFESDAAEAKK
jgi:hypothetical protein